MNLDVPPKENRRTIPANAYHFNKDLTMKGKSDLQSSSKVSEEEEGDYETVSSSTLEAIHALRILPAKPLQESEYADKRCLRPSSTTSPMNSQHTSQPPQYSAKHTSVLEGRSVPSVRGERMKIVGPQHPVPPPRPLKTLPKQYQPLPPAPQISSQFFHTRKTLSQAHTFPISAKVTRHISVKELNKAPGREQVTDLGEKPEASFQAQQYKPKHHPEASLQYTRSSKMVCSSGCFSCILIGLSPSLLHHPTLCVPAPSPALTQLPGDMASWVQLVNGSPKSTDSKSHLLWEDGFQLCKLPQSAVFSAEQYGAGTCSRGPPPSSFS
ncbi:cytokine-dependent hematopoietic cell linker isoform X4 [Aquila chrysaetos chrysaetos]|uniref:cytokine-dependent hematopoietic cell linker isoform X4 n=1 Tax=Aquila chrysaetos chrysaetos TaxID=223781 RepID=UPI0011772241|nr:cytokine-dependent hematopoietic cell linker isoform X4 [Aquila chrysaetos chrysaetos]